MVKNTLSSKQMSTPAIHGRAASSLCSTLGPTNSFPYALSATSLEHKFDHALQTFNFPPLSPVPTTSPIHATISYLDDC